MKCNSKVLLQGFLLLLLIVFPSLSFVTCRDSSLNTIKIVKYVEQEKELKWDVGYELDTALLESGETIFINYTVLTHSLSSVRFTHYPRDGVTWDPLPPNYTLIPGESYTGTFFLNGSAIDNHYLLIYVASVTTENQTATVRWGYELLNGHNIPAVGFFYTFSTLAILSIITLIIIKRKRGIS